MKSLYGTYTGRLIDLNNITEKDICLEDIAHHLSNKQRYNGALPFNKLCSVANHCLNCYMQAKTFYQNNKALQQLCLLHDAAEAYLGDLNSGLKKLLPQYKSIENIVSNIIFEKYINLYLSTLTSKEYKILKGIDARVLVTEVHYLIPDKIEMYTIDPDYNYIPYSTFIWESSSESTKDLFLETCKKLEISD